MADGLHFIIRTPHEAVLDAVVTAARVPTRTGQVGLRPREEPFVCVVEPGLLLVRQDGATRFAATAGGLLENREHRAVLYTPFAVLGDVGADVLAALDEALATPDSELSARRQLGELEQRIIQELHDDPTIAHARSVHD